MKRRINGCGLLVLALMCAPTFAEEAEPRSETVSPVRRVQPVQTAPPVSTLRTPNTPAAAPPAPAEGLTVDMKAVLKNQLQQCKQERLQLDTRNDQLRQQVDSLTLQIVKLQSTLDETTHPGGSLVTAYCEGSNVSRNTAGEVSDCGNYRCEPVSGLCRTVCDYASQCREYDGGVNYVCDSANRQCVPSQ